MSSTYSRTKRFCIVFGRAGAGKSQLIKCLTNEDVKVSDGPICCSKGTKLFESNIDPTLWFMDTRGLGDDKVSDDENINGIFRFLYEEKAKNIQIIWILKPRQNRKTSQLLKQAKFIQKLGIHTPNVWKSVVIVIPLGSNTKRDSQGALEAVHEVTNSKKISTSIKVYTLTIWELLDPEDDMYDNKDDQDFKKRKQKQNKYFLYKKEVPSFYKMISEGIKFANIDFKTNEVCIKCGQRGDHRFFKPFCHSSFKKIHREKEPYHPTDYDFSSNSKLAGKALIAGGVVATTAPTLFALAGTAVTAISTSTSGYVIGSTVVREGARKGGIFLSKQLLARVGTGGVLSGTAGYASKKLDYFKHHKCCKSDSKDSKGCTWKCCGKKVHEEGCIIICSECKKIKGTYKQCQQISNTLKHFIRKV